MQLPTEILRAAGLDPAAKPSDAAILTAIAPRLALANAVMNGLKVADPLAALAEFPRRLARAGEADSAELERNEARVESDTARREQAWNRAISDRAFSAGEVWEQIDGPPGADGKPTRAKRYTSMAAEFNAAYPDVVALEGRLGTMPKLPRGTTASHPDSEAARKFDRERGVPETMTEATASYARKNKIDPGQLAELTATMFAHLLPGA